MAQKVAERVVEGMPWLDPVSETLQSAVQRAVQSGGENARTVKDVLHGTWLGHPLHPAIVAVPLGAWTTTLLLDLAGMESGADLSLGLGIAGAVSAALAGIADWSDTYGQDRRMGTAHALLNTTGLAMNIYSLILRRRGARAKGVAFSTLAYGVAMISGFLGGELAYSRGIGVDHTAWDEGPSDFTPVLDAGNLVDGKPMRAMAGSVPVMLVRQGDQIYALDATCTHMGGPLDEGALEGDAIRCPWHGSIFCLADGSVRHGPATEPAKTFEVRIREGKVEVRQA
jgi:nitrite reductase/ring-hydroxylating ferredoxin subunit/uncharacterized membrane protein